MSLNIARQHRPPLLIHQCALRKRLLYIPVAGVYVGPSTMSSSRPRLATKHVLQRHTVTRLRAPELLTLGIDSGSHATLLDGFTVAFIVG